jgi:hypothetical protein
VESAAEVNPGTETGIVFARRPAIWRLHVGNVLKKLRKISQNSPFGGCAAPLLQVMMIPSQDKAAARSSRTRTGRSKRS